MKKIIAISLVVCLVLTGCASQQEENVLKKDIFAMDTIMTLTLYGENTGDIMNEAISRIYEYEKLFSVNNSESDIYKINHAGGEKVKVSEATYELLQKSIEISEATQGLFDVSIYPIVKAWGFTTEEYKVPSEAELSELLEVVDYRNIRLYEDGSVSVEKEMQLDLGAIAKGYVSQKIIDFLREKGVTSAVVSLGGNVQTLGCKENGEPFQIGIANPKSPNEVYRTFSVRDKAVVTSGTYQRYFEKDGREYHHIMDKRTGKPADNNLVSLTVITDDGIRADGLSTALFIMGEKKALEYQKTHPEIELLLIYEDGTDFYTKEGS